MIVGRDPPVTEAVEARGPAHRNSVFYEDFTVYPAPVPDDAPKPKPKRASIFDAPPSPVLPATPISIAPAGPGEVPALTIDTASTTSSSAPYKSKHLIPSPTTIIDDDESSASLPSPRRARSPALSSTASSPILIPVFRSDPPDAPWTDEGRHRPLAPPLLTRAARSAVDLADTIPPDTEDLRAGYDPATLAVQYVPLRKNLLGTGLHAHVYHGTVRACAGAPSRACAVKVLHELPESQLGGLREAWLLAQCRHAYVLQIVDVIDVANHVDEPAVVPAEDGGKWVRLSLENLGFPPPPELLESSYVYEPPVKEALLAGKDVHGVGSKSSSRVPSRASSPVLSRPASPVAVAGPPPNVVRPPKPPEYALVLELCPGMSMWQFVTKNKTSVGRRLWMRWARQLAQAVAHLHARRIVHHDIKPHNILLDEYRGIKLSDLGSAEIVPEEGFFVDGLGKGTLAYLPPELTKPQPYNAAVDMYALGATLYVCGILGRDPFAGCSTPVHMIMAIERGFLAWPANLPAQHSRVADAAGEVDTRAVNLDTRIKRRGVPIPGSDPRDPRYVRFLNGDLVDEGIWKVLVQCLDKDPEKRPTATELVRELCALDGLDVEVEL
ncbi:serine/threonine protein kinase [Allomyces macrogynus ATCC 38327]|uniref:Serine/threonine protein kinase n=1 Tax=Allomyces macrogynus (strain ATCC 38327) TaxID=578462 RepID=A0A0L0RUU0_ALLM3|nr:serine/threonine protein kinase [Allomyces macrogynus ATCC 38327]|eukprot:KNE54177.1 serine/threonine protein kinase [Allomyces macrogynus ATCC 38327]